MGSNHIKRFSFITVENTKKAIKCFHAGKAPGPDGMTPEQLQNLPDKTVERMKAIFKYSLALKTVPKAWAESNIIFIPKVGKKDYSNPRAFRPISLASFMHKTLERICLWRLLDTHFRNKPIHKSQHAFRMGRSCDSALSQAIDCIESAIHQKEYALSLFLDIKGAFDNLKQEAALEAMKERGIAGWFTDWYGSYLAQRTATATIHGITETRHVPKGSPQGGVFSPTFWNVAFDDLLKIIDQKPFNATGFADDAKTTIRGKFLDISTT